MRLQVVFLPEAARQIEHIEQYIADHGSPFAARRFVERLVNRCCRIGDAPNGGTPRDDLSPGLRSVPFKRAATIFYRVDERSVAIVGVLYRGRDHAAYFR